MSETKIILDACCGSRMFWFDKENPLALFADIRDEEYILCDGRNLKVHPDIVSDFTDMPFLYFIEPKGIMFFWDENWDNATIISGRYHKATVDELIEYFKTKEEQ